MARCRPTVRTHLLKTGSIIFPTQVSSTEDTPARILSLGLSAFPHPRSVEYMRARKKQILISWIHEAQCAGMFFDIYRADYSVGVVFPASNQTLKLGWFSRAGCAGAGVAARSWGLRSARENRAGQNPPPIVSGLPCGTPGIAVFLAPGGLRASDCRYVVCQREGCERV